MRSQHGQTTKRSYISSDKNENINYVFQFLLSKESMWKFRGGLKDLNTPQNSWEKIKLKPEREKKIKKKENGHIKLKTTVISIKSAWNSKQFYMVVWSVYPV